MTEEKVIDPNITSDDKLWALLSYLFSPIIPVLTGDMVYTSTGT